MRGEEEVWKDVIGYEGTYQVSSFGNVRSISRNHAGVIKHRVKLLSQKISNCGYVRVTFFKNWIRKDSSVHRLVATAFIGNGEGFEVNHKDGIKTNNCVENLEWCTQSINTLHAYRTGLMKPPNNGRWIPISIVKDGVVIKSYPSKNELYRKEKIDYKTIAKLLSGELPQYKGFTLILNEK